MNRKTRLILLALTAMTLSLLPVAGPAAAEDEPAHPGLPTYDDDLTAIAEEIPGFGGMYYDERGTLVVWLRGAPGNADERVREQLVRALTERFGEGIWSHGRGSRPEALEDREPFGIPDITVRQARYTIPELARWRTAADAAFALRGVVTTDLDERANRVAIGITRETSARTVLAFLRERGVPEGAVVITTTQVPVAQQATTVGSRARPLEGGRAIGFGGGAGCTLGFTAFNLYGDEGFVTNSHCSNAFAGYDSTTYTQGDTTVIGTEDVDFSFRSFTGCPSGFTCRRADANFVSYSGTDPFELRHIARTTGWLGSLTIDAADPRFRIVATGTIVSGSWADKVGATTGWTYGFLDDTCINMRHTMMTMTQLLLCQNTVSGYGDVAQLTGAGDSGSPWFSWQNFPYGSDVTLLGIHHSALPNQAYFSPFQGIQSDVGTLFPLSQPPPYEEPPAEEPPCDGPNCSIP